MLRNSTVQSTERAKIFPEKIFALEDGAGGATGDIVRIVVLLVKNHD